MTNADKYIDAYKKLEATVRSTFVLKYEDSISYYLKKNKRTDFFHSEIEYCQDVRNLIQHREKISGQYPIQPTDQMVEYIIRIIERLKNRPRCYEIAIPRKEILSAELKDNARQILDKMKQYNFTHVPIIQNDRVIGILSENVIFSYVVDEGIIDIDDGFSIEKLEKYLSVDRKEVEVFSFQPASLFVDQLLEVFEREYHEGKRLGMVFLTSSGKADEQLTGILTPWDVLGHPAQPG